jgi:hypothetical protein
MRFFRSLDFRIALVVIAIVLLARFALAEVLIVSRPHLPTPSRLTPFPLATATASNRARLNRTPRATGWATRRRIEYWTAPLPWCQRWVARQRWRLVIGLSSVAQPASAGGYGCQRRSPRRWFVPLPCPANIRTGAARAATCGATTPARVTPARRVDSRGTMRGTAAAVVCGSVCSGGDKRCLNQCVQRSASYRTSPTRKGWGALVTCCDSLSMSLPSGMNPCAR